jgi:hypothetical protein
MPPSTTMTHSRGRLSHGRPCPPPASAPSAPIATTCWQTRDRPDGNKLGPPSRRSRQPGASVGGIRSPAYRENCPAPTSRPKTAIGLACPVATPRRASLHSAHDGRVAQRESAAFTRQKSQVRSLSRPPAKTPPRAARTGRLPEDLPEDHGLGCLQSRSAWLGPSCRRVNEQLRLGRAAAGAACLARTRDQSGQARLG